MGNPVIVGESIVCSKRKTPIELKFLMNEQIIVYNILYTGLI